LATRTSLNQIADHAAGCRTCRSTPHHNGRTITLTDQGLRERGAKPSNRKHYERGRWNERFLIETDFSWLTEFFDAKKLYHRVIKHLAAHLHYLAVPMNWLLRTADGKRSLADFVI
jgi:hypothetical protein